MDVDNGEEEEMAGGLDAMINWWLWWSDYRLSLRFFCMTCI